MKILNYENKQKFLSEIKKNLDVPETVKIIDYAVGLINEGQDDERPWANLTGVDSELYDKFESIGQSDYTPSFKIKLKQYNGEDLKPLKGLDISLSPNSYELEFLSDRYKNPIGFSLAMKLSDIILN